MNFAAIRKKLHVPGENISLEISENFHRFSDILLRISRLFVQYLCSFIHRFREKTISSLKNNDFLV